MPGVQWDDPLDAIAVHAWNGSWGVIAVGLLAGQGLIFQSYGSDPSYTGDFALNSDQSNLSDAPSDYFRQYGCLLGGNGRLLGAQIIYLMWLCGASLGIQRNMHPEQPTSCCRGCAAPAACYCACPAAAAAVRCSQQDLQKTASSARMVLGHVGNLGSWWQQPSLLPCKLCAGRAQPLTIP